jgi:hypothetical protein
MRRTWNLLMSTIDAANSILSFNLLFVAAFALPLAYTAWKLA